MVRKVFTAILLAFVLFKVEAIKSRELENLIATVLRRSCLSGVGKMFCLCGVSCELAGLFGTVAKASSAASWSWMSP